MKDLFTKSWIIENSVDILKNYEDGVLTIRGLHYQLVSRGMTNDINHYKRVVAATGDARWKGIISFTAFSDRERAMACLTKADYTNYEDEVERGKEQVRLWMQAYYLNRWENQPVYPEVLIEKKALEGVFLKECKILDIGLGACKGYPSLTFLREIADRIIEKQNSGKKAVILYFGDYDPSGEDIPRAIYENLLLLGCDDTLDIRRICLMEKQVVEWGLPPAPTKITDSRSVHWTGMGQVELDAVKPEKLIELLKSAVADIFDETLYSELKEQETLEGNRYQSELKEYVSTLS